MTDQIRTYRFADSYLSQLQADAAAAARLAAVAETALQSANTAYTELRHLNDRTRAECDRLRAFAERITEAQSASAADLAECVYEALDELHAESEA